MSRPEHTFIVGIDEAGRGPLAGPVAVGIVKLRKDFDLTLVEKIKHKDSKKLSAQKRSQWFETIRQWKKDGLLDYHVALVSHTVIDTQGISFAIKKGIDECLKKVKAVGEECEVLLDGSLKAPSEFVYQKTIIKGDEKEPAIGLASIMAKVTRDLKMEKYDELYPEYKFDVHKGYGTKVHRDAIRKYGISPIHRTSFLKNIVKKAKIV